MTVALLAFVAGLMVGSMDWRLDGVPLVAAAVAAAAWVAWYVFHAEHHPGRWWGEP